MRFCGITLGGPFPPPPPPPELPLPFPLPLPPPGPDGAPEFELELEATWLGVDIVLDYTGRVVSCQSPSGYGSRTGGAVDRNPVD